MKNSWKSLLLLGAVLFFSAGVYGQLPEGFDYTLVTDEISQSANIDFADSNKVYVADFLGRVWMIEDGSLISEPILDISDEVAGTAELGCLGFALHPDFMLNGYFYLLYVVDRHHLLYFGTDDYDPNANEYGSATMGRLVRYQVQLSDYITIVPESRTILFGSEIGTGSPCLTASHGTGDLLFGSDGTLICSLGDGNTWANYYAGGEQEPPPYCYEPQGLADGIISTNEHVGAFRAQQLESYSGKILRINPETGDGVASNPFYDNENPNSARSKIWALGLRNPYRLTLKPGTGSSDPSDANPGTIYISDVGFNRWEEINVADGPGYNFGWPLYEGMKENEGMWGTPGYFETYRQNKFQPNPYNTEDCDYEYFFFQDLIQQENEQHNYDYPNPCDSGGDMSNYVDVFVHSPPVMAYKNEATSENDSPVVPGFNEEGALIGKPITSEEQNIENAEIFDGIAAMVGDFYSGSSYPEEYQNMLPVLDYKGWLRTFWFDDNHELIKMEHWLDSLQNVVDMRYNPFDQCYYTIGLYPSEIKKVCYVGNLRPVINASAIPTTGPAPLTVNFDASGTYDPDGDPMIFEWDFGDGAESNDVSPEHVYTTPNGNPTTYYATLTVSDSEGNTAYKNFLISPNNSPPNVEISNVANNQLYSMEAPSVFNLQASVSDNEHINDSLSYHWVNFFHHNTHFHPLSESIDQTTIIETLPVGCGAIDTYHYRVTLTVTDPNGLTGYDEVLLYPDCDGVLPNPPGSIEVKPESALAYPNPSLNGTFHVLLGTVEYDQSVDVYLYDYSGRAIFTKTYSIAALEPKITLRIPELSPGTYILKVIGNDIDVNLKLLRLYPE